MQSPCIDACNTFKTSHRHHFLGFRSLSSKILSLRNSSVVSCRLRERRTGGGEGGVRGKGKDNVWSVDNDVATAEKEKEARQRRRGRGKEVRKRGAKRSNSDEDDDMVMVSGSMLMEIETVLQIQEPVIRPAWNTFASSVSGIWKGVGAVFSPITAEMEPIEIGKKNENLYECYTLSRILVEPSPSSGQVSQIRRKINWVTWNPHGETQLVKQKSNSFDPLPKFESFDFGSSDVMEEDLMGLEPGLVFFEDGSYSRGPVDIPVGEINDTNYFLNPTFKFEQCLVKGCHKRLRIAHTIEFSNGGTDIQIMRIAVYEEQWVGPANISDQSDLELDSKPFSQRKRVSPSELTGSWKVFEVSATPIHSEEVEEESNGPPCVYFCMETLKKRNLPDNAAYFGEEEIRDIQDVTVLWLPGGVTAYVDVDKDGILCIGVGWYSDEGINLVMERDYGMDGKLKEVRSKTEVKRRWSDPLPE